MSRIPDAKTCRSFQILCGPKNSVAVCPSANYTDRSTAATGEINANFAVDRFVLLAQRIPTAVNLGCLDRSRYFFNQAAPHLFSQGCMDSVTDPLLLRKSGSAGSRIRDL
jgi:hypothetical protein